LSVAARPAQISTAPPSRHVFAATRAGAERRPTVAAVLESLGAVSPG
jgi:hypothetical protein